MAGRPRVGDRQVINGMVCEIRTGICWRAAVLLYNLLNGMVGSEKLVPADLALLDSALDD